MRLGAQNSVPSDRFGQRHRTRVIARAFTIPPLRRPPGKGRRIRLADGQTAYRRVVARTYGLSSGNYFTSSGFSWLNPDNDPHHYRL